ncbi:chemotaxis protein CheB [Methylophaga sp. OBS4]|uniref:chemotaxis protein CheB n=1 Tax=Methylophaga sp. OBS4 TaxID=2991935 RepID=UPI00224D8FDF|nr:chemotaxis protein CheB [Methylophaga sp. OBS4]MCX4187111.1 chemotaxis protein CheB [Methylophaga sp. OBS4]
MNIPHLERYEAVVLGASFGGMQLLKLLLTALPRDFSLPIIAVQHTAPTSQGTLAELLNSFCDIEVREANEKEPIEPEKVYFAPANYHLLIEPDRTFTLTVDERVNHARPAIDVLFETAAEAYGVELVGLVLTGANADGAEGLRYLKDKGGLAVVQDPDTAVAPSMPQAAIRIARPQHVLTPGQITDLLLQIHHNRQEDVT